MDTTAVINAGDTAWVIVATALVLLMTPGLALFYAGLVRRKNVLNTLMSSFFVMGVASLLWVLIGYTLCFSGNTAGIIGNFDWFGFKGVGWDPNPDLAVGIPHNLFAAFQMMFAIITPALITGALAERMKFSALVIFTIAWSVVVYYPLAHMFWGIDGLLKNFGAIDFAGGNVVHISSGIAALVACIMVGKRKGFGMLAYQPHNIPMVFTGAGLLWFGWFGFNGGSALGAGGLAVHAILTTNTSGAAAMVSWMLIEKITKKTPTLLGAVTGLIVGLAAVTQSAGFIPIWAAAIVGAVASPLSYLGISVLKKKLGYDDALDTFGCHGIGGLWGAVATGLFAQTSINSAAKWDGLVYGGDPRLFTAQIVSALVTVAVSAVGTFVILAVIKLFIKLRVSSKEEVAGLDLSEHSESAYPAFTGLD